MRLTTSWLPWGLSMLATALLTGCAGEPGAPQGQDVTLVIVGVVSDASGQPVDQAIVHLQAMGEGRSGGNFGCTGSFLIDHSITVTEADGRFAMEVGGQPTGGAPVCVIALATRRRESTWRDTASVVRSSIPRTAATPPDTIRVDLALPR